MHGFAGEDAQEEKSIAVPLNEDAMNLLRACEGMNPTPVLISQGRPLDYKVNNTAFRAARARAGLPKLLWHDLRHTWAS